MRKKRKVIDPVEEEILIQLKQSGQQSTSEINDEDLSFGQMIATNLKRLTPQQKAQAKIRIQQLLYEIEFTSSFTHYQSCVLPHHTTQLIMLTTIPVIQACQAMTSKVNLL